MTWYTNISSDVWEDEDLDDIESIYFDNIHVFGFVPRTMVVLIILQKSSQAVKLGSRQRNLVIYLFFFYWKLFILSFFIHLVVLQ